MKNEYVSILSNLVRVDIYTRNMEYTTYKLKELFEDIVVIKKSLNNYTSKTKHAVSNDYMTISYLQNNAEGYFEKGSFLIQLRKLTDEKSEHRRNDSLTDFTAYDDSGILQLFGPKYNPLGNINKALYSDIPNIIGFFASFSTGELMTKRSFHDSLYKPMVDYREHLE